MTDEEVRELAALHALGALDEESSRVLMARLNELAPDLRREMSEWQEIASLLPHGLEQPEVPPRVRERLLAATARRASDPQNTFAGVAPIKAGRVLFASPLSGYLLMAASLILALTSLILYRGNANLTDRVAVLKRDLDTRTAELLAERRQHDEVVAHSTRMISLDGDAAAPQASARLFWDTEHQEWVIYFFNLPLAPSDKDYQLWYITRDQRKVSARVFRQDPSGRVELRVALPRDLISALAATAVTLEPRGGSPQPTGQLVLKGAI